jgi:hypothetical protein
MQGGQSFQNTRNTYVCVIIEGLVKSSADRYAKEVFKQRRKAMNGYTFGVLLVHLVVLLPLQSVSMQHASPHIPYDDIVASIVEFLPGTSRTLNEYARLYPLDAKIYARIAHALVFSLNYFPRRNDAYVLAHKFFKTVPQKSRLQSDFTVLMIQALYDALNDPFIAAVGSRRYSTVKRFFQIHGFNEITLSSAAASFSPEQLIEVRNGLRELREVCKSYDRLVHRSFTYPYPLSRCSSQRASTIMCVSYNICLPLLIVSVFCLFILYPPYQFYTHKGALNIRMIAKNTQIAKFIGVQAFIAVAFILFYRAYEACDNEFCIKVRALLQKYLIALDVELKKVEQYRKRYN